MHIACSVFRIQNDINTFKERMGWSDLYLLMSLFFIQYGQGSGTTVAIPVNENTKLRNTENIQLNSNE
jgi:hypothetical protein